MQELKNIDEVAYVRFASVYRQFGDINTFMAVSYTHLDVYKRQIQRCKESVWKYKGMWEDFSHTVGFWADMEHPYAVSYTHLGHQVGGCSRRLGLPCLRRGQRSV